MREGLRFRGSLDGHVRSLLPSSFLAGITMEINLFSLMSVFLYKVISNSKAKSFKIGNLRKMFLVD